MLASLRCSAPAPGSRAFVPTQTPLPSGVLRPGAGCLGGKETRLERDIVQTCFIITTNPNQQNNDPIDSTVHSLCEAH